MISRTIMRKGTRTILAIALTLGGCGGGGGGGSEASDEAASFAYGTSGPATGTVTLSGADTALLGDELDAGVIGAAWEMDSEPDQIVIVSEGDTVTVDASNGVTPVISDGSDFTVVTVAAGPFGLQLLSMTVVIAATSHNYACSTPVTSFVDCGATSITMDFGGRSITFDETTVTNVDTSTVLTLSGTLEW